MKISSRGSGAWATWGRGPGDPFGRPHIRPRLHLHREGSNLIYELRLRLVQAALGGQDWGWGLEGGPELSVAPGTRDCEVFELESEGLPHPGSRIGAGCT